VGRSINTWRDEDTIVPHAVVKEQNVDNVDWRMEEGVMKVVMQKKFL
jgi:hypothetical protein